MDNQQRMVVVRRPRAIKIAPKVAFTRLWACTRVSTRINVEFTFESEIQAYIRGATRVTHCLN